MVYNKEYYDNNKDKFLQWQRKYRKNNHSSISINRKKYDKENHKHKLELNKQWKQNNPQKIKDQKKKDDATYYSKNKTNIVFIKKKRISNNIWKQNNPDKVLNQQIKSLKKLGLSLNMTHFKVRMALKTWSGIIKNNFISCKICGDKAVHVHHIFHKSKYPKLALNKNNGIPLCLLHHNEVHGINLRYGGD